VTSPIFVTRPFLPPLEEFIPLLQQIWDSRVLTNNGPFHVRLEAELAAYLGVENVSLVTNGMLALTAVFDALQLEGEVITTPYSFVATTHAVRIGRLSPVFVDVRPSDLNIDPDLIEAAITDRTSAIVAVHVYGNPCAVEEIEEIAQRHGLKVIYDAAHAFAVRYKGRGLLSWGDFATLSFHATKAFNTFEGGAIISGSASGKQGVDSARNFGIADEVNIPTVGTNAKMSEFNAALGLLQLRHFAEVREARRQVDARYRSALANVPGLTCVAIPPDVEPNFSYFPILVDEAISGGRDAIYAALQQEGIFARRYFYPLLSNLPMYETLASAKAANLPVANRAAEQILCLPIFPELSATDQDRIIDIVKRAA
jgi:dTDP-4-amino-4,6-dideoxygalactose transaminase